MGFRDYNSGIGKCCYECTERYPGCHDHCEKYADARQTWDNRKETIRQLKSEEKLYRDYKYKHIAKDKAKGKDGYGKYK